MSSEGLGQVERVVVLFAYAYRATKQPFGFRKFGLIHVGPAKGLECPCYSGMMQAQQLLTTRQNGTEEILRIAWSALTGTERRKGLKYSDRSRVLWTKGAQSQLKAPIEPGLRGLKLPLVEVQPSELKKIVGNTHIIRTKNALSELKRPFEHLPRLPKPSCAAHRPSQSTQSFGKIALCIWRAFSDCHGTLENFDRFLPTPSIPVDPAQRLEHLCHPPVISPEYLLPYLKDLSKESLGLLRPPLMTIR